MRFRILKVEDIRKGNSVVAVGNELVGNLSGCQTKIYFTDNENVDWIFYIGDTCELC